MIHNALLIDKGMNVNKEQYFQMFQREKRYLYIVGLLILFTRILNVEMEEIDAFGIIKADIHNPENVNTMLGVFFLWFMYRFNVFGSKAWEEGEINRLYHIAVNDSGTYQKWKMKKREEHALTLSEMMNIPEIDPLSIQYVSYNSADKNPLFTRSRIDHCEAISGRDARDYMSNAVIYPPFHVRMIAQLRGLYSVLNSYVGISELIAPIMFICVVSIVIFIDGVLP